MNRAIKLLLGFISLLFAGIIYAWSILKEPLAAEFSWTPSQLALNFTFTMWFFCIGGIAAGVMVRKLKPRYVVMTGGLLSGASFILTAANSGSLTALYMTYGVLGGTGIGMAYNAVISSTNAWFPDKKGTSSGTMMMGFGLSSLILGNIANIMIGLSGVGWRATYVLIGASLGLVLIVTGFFMSVPGPEVKLPEPKKKTSKDDYVTIELDASEMRKRLTFWKLFIFFTFIVGVGNSVISFAKDLSLSVGAGDSPAAVLVGVLAVCNGLGRIMCGLSYDTFGRNRTMLYATFVNIAAPFVLLMAVMTGSITLCVAGICLTGIGYGCCPTLKAAVMLDFYGGKNFNLNFSILLISLIPASMFATVSNLMAQNTGSYQSTFIMLLSCALTALVINFSIKGP